MSTPTAKAVQGRNPVGPRDELAVSCWCEHQVVFVPKADLAAGLTKACHRQPCRAEDRAERAVPQVAA